MKTKYLITSLILAVIFFTGCKEQDTEKQVHSKSTTEATETINTYVGKIGFQDQTIMQASAEELHKQIDLQRASQLTLWAMPAVNVYQLHKSFKDMLKSNPEEPVVGLFYGYESVYPFLTANSTTPYTVSAVNLKATGPLVVQIPEGGVYGVANDAWMQPIKEINSGKAEKLLFVGPDQEYPKNFDGEIIQSPTYKMLYMYRVLGTGEEAEKLKTAVKAYKLSEASNPHETQFISYEPKQGESENVVLNTQPTDMKFWEIVHEFVQTEPMADRDRFFYAWLRNLGIEKGKPFQPSDYQKEVFTEGLTVGMAMAQALAFNKRFESAKYMGDSGWEDVMAGMDPKIDMETYSMFDERASYNYEATTTSSGMTERIEGQGSAYLGTYYDSDGNALMGSNTYKLHIEPNPPAANFWSIAVYDIKNRLLIRNSIKRSGISSRKEDLIVNKDGSVDLFFGPNAPNGKEPNWVQTNPGESFFLYLRLYGPLKPFINQEWKMNKVEKVK